MSYTKTTWVPGDDITAAKLNNMELQYDAAKTDFGPVTATITVAKQGESLHPVGADYVVASGSTSAEDTINAAITAAAAVGGGMVLLLEGTYTIDSPILLKNFILLRGMGPGTIIKLKDAVGVNMCMIQNETQTAPGNEGMRVENLTVDGNKGAQPANYQHGIYFTNCTEITSQILVRNCHVKDCGGSGDGVLANASNNVTVDSCIVTGAGVGFLGITTIGFKVINCTAKGNAWGVYLSNCIDSVIANLTSFNNIQDGIRIESGTKGTTVSGCALYNNAHNGLLLTGTGTNNNTVISNVFDSNAFNGILVELSAHYNTLLGNMCASNGGNNIAVSSSDNIIIDGNTCRLASGDGISVTASNWSEIANNVVYMNGHNGILCVTAVSCIISGNNVSANSTSADNTYLNIYLVTSASYNSITLNLCFKGGGPNLPYAGVYIAAGCNYNLVTANYLQDGGKTAFLVDYGTGTDKTAWMVAGNKIAFT